MTAPKDQTTPEDFKIISNTAIEVKIGEVKIAQGGESLIATLTSCVGVAFYWPEKKICGIAHCILPETSRDVQEVGARYVTQGIASLVKLMDIKKEDIPSIQVWVAGGGVAANLMSGNNLYHFGVQSLKVAQITLQKSGFNLKTINIGEEKSRQIYIGSTDGHLIVNKFLKTA